MSHSNAVQRFDVTFPELGHTSAEIAISGLEQELAAGNVSVSLRRRGRRCTTVFSTHNRRGEHLMPPLARESCPECGCSSDVILDPEDVTIHVIGPRELSADEEEFYRHEATTRVGADAYACQYAPARKNGQFVVSRGGHLVGLVSSDVMREALKRCPRLVVALGLKPKEIR
jgi:hypothetical protein